MSDLVCISQAHVITLSKSSSLAHLQENLGAVGWEMEHDDVEKMRKDFPRQVFVSDVGALV